MDVELQQQREDLGVNIPALVLAEHLLRENAAAVALRSQQQHDIQAAWLQQQWLIMAVVVASQHAVVAVEDSLSWPWN